MVVVFMYFFVCLRKHHNVELETMDANINAPMACAPVIRATIWPQIRRIVSPRIVICQSHHIVHQVSNHKTEILNDVNRQINKNNNSNLTIIWKKIMAVIADATFAVAKRKLSYRNCKSCVYKCDDLLSHNSLPCSRHIWFSHIHNFSNLRVILFRSMRRVFIYHGPKNVFSDIRTSELVYQNVVGNPKVKTRLCKAKTILSFERKCWAFSSRLFCDWMSVCMYSLGLFVICKIFQMV